MKMVFWYFGILVFIGLDIFAAGHNIIAHLKTIYIWYQGKIYSRFYKYSIANSSEIVERNVFSQLGVNIKSVTKCYMDTVVTTTRLYSVESYAVYI